jgi:hypothetical protein
MRILPTAVMAALIAAGSLSALAQTTGTAPSTTAQAAAPKAKACKGRAEADCQAPECVWVAPTTTSAGKPKKGYCRKPPKAKAAAPAKPS